MPSLVTCLVPQLQVLQELMVSHGFLFLFLHGLFIRRTRPFLHGSSGQQERAFQEDSPCREITYHASTCFYMLLLHCGKGLNPEGRIIWNLPTRQSTI